MPVHRVPRGDSRPRSDRGCLSRRAHRQAGSPPVVATGSAEYIEVRGVMRCVAIAQPVRNLSLFCLATTHYYAARCSRSFDVGLSRFDGSARTFDVAQPDPGRLGHVRLCAGNGGTGRSGPAGRHHSQDDHAAAARRAIGPGGRSKPPRACSTRSAWTTTGSTRSAAITCPTCRASVARSSSASRAELRRLRGAGRAA